MQLDDRSDNVYLQQTNKRTNEGRSKNNSQPIIDDINRSTSRQLNT